MKKKEKTLIVFLASTLLLSVVVPTCQGADNPEWPFGLLMRGEETDQSYYLENNSIFNLDPETKEPFSGYLTLGMEAERSYGFGSLYLNPTLSYSYDAQSQDPELKLNEGYLNIYLDKMDIRIGKQRVTWGKADGLVITNVVNPRDLTRYPIIDFYEDSFKSIYSMKVDYYQGMNTWEGIWIPEFEPVSINDKMFISRIRKMVNSGILPKKLAKLLPKDLSKIKFEKEKIDSGLAGDELGFDLEKTEFAGRYSSMGAEFDYEIVTGYLWDDYPTLHINTNLSPNKYKQNSLSQESKPPAPTFKLKHHRLSLIGGSASTARGDFVFRGEALLTHGKMFNSPNHDEFVVAKDQFEWMFGAEYSTDYLVDSLNFQVDQEVILDYGESIITDEFTTKMTFLVQGQYLRNRLTAKANLIYNLNQESLLSKTELTYDQSGSTNFVVGLDRVLEEGEGLVSALYRDAVYIQAEYFF